MLSLKLSVSRTHSLRLVVLTSLLTLNACAGDEAAGQNHGPVVEPIDIATANLIDDFEDGDGLIYEGNGRIGAWYSYNDESAGGVQQPATDGDFTPEAGGPPESAYAARTTGSGFAEWGAGIAFDLNHVAEEAEAGALKGVFDASSFQGIAFRAKGNAPLRVSLAVQGVISVEYGGTCVPGETEEEDCHDTHGLTFDLSEEWQQFAVPFAAAAQGGWGQAVAFDAATLTSVQFQVTEGLDFDISLDDIGLY